MAIADAPAYVGNLKKPPKSAIKRIGNNYYLYECTNQYDNRFRRLQTNYEYSVLSNLFPGMSFSPYTVTQFLRLMGVRREAIASYMKEDQDLDEWMMEYARRNNTYFADQARNFLHMKKSFEKYCMEHK